MANVGILRTVLALAVSAIVSAFAWGDPATPDEAAVQRRQVAQTKPATVPAATMAAGLEPLIKDLGSESFQTRERADAAIRKIGATAAAVAHLRKHLDNPDPEIADRIAGILNFLEQPILRANKAAYRQGEPISLALTFKNFGTVDAVVNLEGLRELSGLVAIDQAGNSVKCVTARTPFVRGGRVADLKLAPGQEHSVSIVAVNSHTYPKTRSWLRRTRLAIDHPGTYRLRFCWGNYVGNEVTIVVLGAN